MSKPNSTRTELQQSLERLHAELASTTRVSETSRRLLREVLADIERLLKSGPSTDASSAAASRATESAAIDTAPRRLEALAVEFEAGHPTLAASLRQFVDLLGSMGL